MIRHTPAFQDLIIFPINETSFDPSDLAIESLIPNLIAKHVLHPNVSCHAGLDRSSGQSGLELWQRHC